MLANPGQKDFVLKGVELVEQTAIGNGKVHEPGLA